MELWIRSQDRKNLVKIDRLAIDDTNSIFCDYNDFFLASYKTKERALEVLDEIQMYISENFTLGTISQIMGTQPRSRIVYEMPEE